jgi:hypothetical protein
VPHRRPLEGPDRRRKQPQTLVSALTNAWVVNLLFPGRLRVEGEGLGAPALPIVHPLYGRMARLSASSIRPARSR